MSTNVSVIPILSTNSTFPRLAGTCAPGVDPYTNIIIDVYQLDPEGWTNGMLFTFQELFTPDLSSYNGFPQGRKYLGSFVDNGPSDSDPVVGSFSLDVSALDVGASPVTVTANYSADPPGTHNGRTHTSNFSNPITVLPTVGMPTLSATLVTANNSIVLAWPADANGFAVQATATLSPVNWGDLDPQPPIIKSGNFNTATIPIGSGNQYYRLRQ